MRHLHGHKAGRLAAAQAADRAAGVRRRTREQAAVEAGDYTRDEVGDVSDWRAFDVHMQRVGEEDQSSPGWDDLP